MELTVGSPFSGIGGIDLAFQQAGFRLSWAIEKDAAYCRTYKHNFKDAQLIENDIRFVDPSMLSAVDVITAGFSCQPFSVAGKQRGFEDDRGSLFFQVARVVEATRPKVIFLENVANLLEHDEGKSFLIVYNALVPFGYSFKYQVMEPYEYGNRPQTRARVFIVGFLNDMDCFKFSFPEKIELTETLNSLFDRSVRHSDCYYYNEDNRFYKELKSCVNQKDCIYKIFDWGINKKPYYLCPALTAYMEKCLERVPIILDDFGIRRLTPYECLKLQGFPSDFRFAPGTPMRKAYKQVGNSFCVPVIRRIAEKIMKVMSDGNE